MAVWFASVPHAVKWPAPLAGSIPKAARSRSAPYCSNAADAGCCPRTATFAPRRLVSSMAAMEAASASMQK